jgi:hypothetical protein
VFSGLAYMLVARPYNRGSAPLGDAQLLHLKSVGIKQSGLTKPSSLSTARYRTLQNSVSGQHPDE